MVLCCRAGWSGAGGWSAPPIPEMWVCLSVLGILETAPAELNFGVWRDFWSPYCLQGSVPASETQKPHPGVLKEADEEEGRKGQPEARAEGPGVGGEAASGSRKRGNAGRETGGWWGRPSERTSVSIKGHFSLGVFTVR